MSKLTEKGLQALRPGDAGTVVREDGNLAGRVRANGDGKVSVSFYWRYKFQCKTRELACGTWPKSPLTAIRKTREKARQILEQGRDPAAERRTDKLQQRLEQQACVLELQGQLARLTVSDLYARWIALELSKRKDGGAEVKRGFEKDVLPQIGSMAAEDVKRGHITGILDSILARGANRLANRTLSELRQMFGFGYVRDIVKIDPTHMLKKADIGGKEIERDRVLSEAEIRELAGKLPEGRLMKATETAVWIMLSTCCRVGEISQARWENLDLENGCWTIPEHNAKNSRRHVVYLSVFALRHFQTLRDLSTDREWMFPARDGGSICTKNLTRQIRDRQRKEPLRNRTHLGAGALLLSGGEWTPHDLRRTGATLMGELGARPDVIERCLNHVEPSRVTRTYQRQKLETEQRAAWDALGKRLDLLLTCDDVANVLPLPHRVKPDWQRTKVRRGG